jgi:hypothetical protein
VNTTSRRITTFVSGTFLTATLVLGHVGGAQAKDAFCAKLPALRAAVNEIGAIDSKDLTAGFAAFAKGAKTFKDSEKAAPKAISANFKTMSTGMQAINNEIQKLKKIDITKADAMVKTMEANVGKIASDPKFGKAADAIASWGKKQCNYDLTA